MATLIVLDTRYWVSVYRGLDKINLVKIGSIGFY